MGLLDEMGEAPSAGQVPVVNLPNGWTPSVAYDPSGAVDVVTIGVGQPAESTWADEVRAMGVTIPDGWTVRLVEVRHDPAAWVRHAQGEDATTEAVTRRRYAVEPARGSVDLDELLKAIGKPRAKAKTTTGAAAYVHCMADLQIGKIAYGQGTEETIGFLLSTLDQSVERLKYERKRRPIGTVVLAMLGDLCEGNSSQGGAVLLQSDLGVTEQVRVVRRLLLEHVKAFAPLVDRVVVPTAPGNHDQPHRFGGISPKATDSWAVDVACQVADALAMAPGYDHCQIVCPEDDDLTVTIEAGDTIIGLAHGHQIKRGDGHGWWARQAHARHRIGAADLLLTGHYHHLRIENSGPKVWMQAMASDAGSPWFDQRYGGRGKAGTLTFIAQNHGFTSLEVLT